MTVVAFLFSVFIISSVNVWHFGDQTHLQKILLYFAKQIHFWKCIGRSFARYNFSFADTGANYWFLRLNVGNIVITSQFELVLNLLCDQNQ